MRTFFAPRLLAINGANNAIGPPAEPLMIAPIASACSAFARSST